VDATELGLSGHPDPVPMWNSLKSPRDQRKAMEPFMIRSQTGGKPYWLGNHPWIIDGRCRF
jgi:hypothetical protein